MKARGDVRSGLELAAGVRLGLLCGLWVLAGCPGDTAQNTTLSGGTGTGGVDPSSEGGGTMSTGSPDTTSGADADADASVGDDTLASTSTGEPATSDTTAMGESSSEGGGSSDTGPAPECVMDSECPLGSVCENEACVPGCNAGQACAGTETCCNGTCIDTDSDIDNCGDCGIACDQPPNIAAECVGGRCGLGDCDAGTYDCDGMGTTGCESNEMCVCQAGIEVQSCYPGPVGTDMNAPCQAGQRTCNAAGTGFGPCVGFVTPIAEICANNVDDDCNGVADDIIDVDGDGWTQCQNDCCENIFQCSDPALVNPGAFEFVGNLVDDDCDPASSDVVAAPDCSAAAIFGNVTGDAMAQAMDLCQFTTENEPLPTRKWGVIEAEFVRPDFGAPTAAHLGDMEDFQSAVMANYGTGGIAPTHGATMAGMSSGRMRDQNDPNYVAPNQGSDLGQALQPPAAYLAANGGALPSSAGCSGNCPAGTGAYDPIVLRLRIRVPTNALSFSYGLRYFTSEYWCWACTVYNDFFLAILDSNAAGLPADGNISFDSLGNPISVNNGFFDLCQADGCYTCPNGTGALAGTGMQLIDNIWCLPSGTTGGGTVWLETTAPIVPGETIELYLMVFDVSDAILDSLVLLDDFQWSIDPSDVGTTPQ
jgi:hypothetical protein